VAGEALREILASGPVVTGATHAAFTVKPAAARSAALAVAGHAPEDTAMLLDMLGITGTDGPDGGKWSTYMYGRRRRREDADA
jgi:hypothetical protein